MRSLLPGRRHAVIGQQALRAKIARRRQTTHSNSLKQKAFAAVYMLTLSVAGLCHAATPIAPSVSATPTDAPPSSSIPSRTANGSSAPPSPLPPTATPQHPAPPPGYVYVPVRPPTPIGYRPAPELPYEAGEPVPLGYRVVSEPRYGLVTGGYVLSGVSYGLSAMIALSADFKNSSAFLMVPFVGPWLTIGRRRYGDCSRDDTTVNDGLRCTADVFVVMGLIMDGLLQAGGGAMLLTGYLAERKKLARNDIAWVLRPRIGDTGFGLMASGTF